MIRWYLQCWCTEWDDSETLLWAEFFPTLRAAKAGAEDDLLQKMGKDRWFDGEWERDGKSYWNGCANLVYTVRKA